MSTYRMLNSLRVVRQLYRTNVPKIGTHDGAFHADEVLACVLLKQLDQYKNAEIVRSRDMKIIDNCDIVVDVGARFEPENKRFDHHQLEFTETMRSLKILNFDTKLSSAGLVYAFYGKNIVNKLTGIAVDSPECEVIYEKVYKTFIEEYDGVDNGIARYEGEPKYTISSTVSARVKTLNLNWYDTDQSHAAAMTQFTAAMEMVEMEFKAKLSFLTKGWLPARAVVKSAIDKIMENDDHGGIIEFPHGIPWKSHLFQLEKEYEIVGQIMYVMYNSKPNEWIIQCVPDPGVPFSMRKSLPETWRGVRDEVLANISGVPDALFCHTVGFIGGAKSQDGVLQMAKIALNS